MRVCRSPAGLNELAQNDQTHLVLKIVYGVVLDRFHSIRTCQIACNLFINSIDAKLRDPKVRFIPTNPNVPSLI